MVSLAGTSINLAAPFVCSRHTLCATWTDTHIVCFLVEGWLGTGQTLGLIAACLQDDLMQ